MPKCFEHQRPSVFRAAFSALTRFMRPKPPETVVLDEEGVRRLRGPEVIERVRWTQLIHVAIVTTDEGPFVEDLFWLLQESDGSGCALSGTQAETTKLLERLQRLPRFDNEAVIAASGSTSNALFVCWEGSPGEGTACSTQLD